MTNKKMNANIRTVLISTAGWIVLYVAFGLIESNMFAVPSILNLLRSMSKYVLVGVGQAVVLIMGNIDLSMGSVAAMSTMIIATLMSHGTPAGPALLIALAACLLIGLINGVLVGEIRLPSFIATLGTMFCARGIAYTVNGNRNTEPISMVLGEKAADSFQYAFYYGKTLGIYNAFWLALIVFLLVWMILEKTVMGRHIYAAGSNTRNAEMSGVNVFGVTTVSYLISAFCSFMIGAVLTGQAGMGSIDAGTSYEMYGVAACVIGGISPIGGIGSLLGVIAGAGVWQTLETGLTLAGAPIGIQRIVIGALVVVAVSVDVLTKGKKAKS